MIKASFLRVLRGTVFCGFILAAVLTSFPKTAHAADNVITGIYFSDLNKNGQIDGLLLYIDNDAAQTWTIDGTPATAALDVTQDGADIAITGASFYGSASADPVAILVTLDENDADLQVTTDGLTEGVIEASYNDVDGTNTCTNCIRDTSGELVSFATGDATAEITEVDMAGPAIVATDFKTAALSGITYNAVQVTYSEVITVSSDRGGDSDIAPGATGASTASLGSMSTPKRLDGILTWDGASDMAGSSPTANIVGLDATGKILTVYINANSGYYSTGSTAPTTPTITSLSDDQTIADVRNNQVPETAYSSTNTAAWDVTKPIFSNTYSCDLDHDGDIETFQVNTNESMRDSSISGAYANFEGDNDSTNNATGEETFTSFSTSSQGCDGSAVDTDANDNKFTLGLSSGISGTELAYVHLVSPAPTDWAGNRANGATQIGTESDKASPVITSSTPSSGAGGITRSSSVLLTFSEAVSSITTSLSPTATLTNTTTLPAAALTLTGVKLSGTNTLTISTAPDSSANAFHSFVATGTSAISFNVAAASTSSTTTAAPLVYEIVLTAPTASSTVSPNQPTTITWSTAGSTGSIGAINLAYSVDDGATWTSIVSNTTNDGTYIWDVPADLEDDSVLIRAEGTDLVTVLDSDTSDAFSVGTSEDSTDTTTDDTADGADSIDGTSDTILPEGTFMKGASWSTVYMIGADGTRRPFMDSQTFFTYADNFDEVVEVSDDHLANYMIGEPMVPKAGTVLVKIQSVNSVYVLGDDATLRWIVSEEVASALYGSNWADYVIDVPVTAWGYFNHGEDIDSTSHIEVNVDAMKTRDEVND